MKIPFKWLVLLWLAAMIAVGALVVRDLTTATYVGYYEAAVVHKSISYFQKPGSYDNLERYEQGEVEEEYYLYLNNGFSYGVSENCYYSVTEGTPVKVLVWQGREGQFSIPTCP